MVDTIWTVQLIISLAISAAMAIGFICWQFYEFRINEKAIAKLASFFSKKEAFSTYESYDNDVEGNHTSKSVKIKEVATDDAELKNLIEDINAYIGKSKGTVAFSIIQNKTERRITMLYEIATSKLSFPTHIGLMGTFTGVFVGLFAFLIGTWTSGGITDSNIQSLISGVLVSMITSCCGIYLLIRSHKKASEATNQIDRDKNDFYEWVQNELMPSVDVSMVEAIGKLHETIDKFEPTFSEVISQFKDAFKDVAGAFGTDFRQSVKVVADAVETMGSNMDKVNANIELQGRLLKTIKSNQLIKGMDAFIEASKRFSEITAALYQFEQTRNIMLSTAQETINIQKEFNDSLQIPKQVAAEINLILNRITKFEENINGLGINIAHTQMVGNALVEQIKENIRAIKGKQKIAEDYAETAGKKLEVYFEGQKKEVTHIMQRYNEALEAYLSDYETMLKERKQELESRNHEFVEAIKRNLSLEDIHNDFAALRKINNINSKLEQIAATSVDGNELNKILKDIHIGLDSISAIQEGKKRNGFWTGLSNNHSTTYRDNQERTSHDIDGANQILPEERNKNQHWWEKQKRTENKQEKRSENEKIEEEIHDKIREDKKRDQKGAEAIAKYTESIRPNTSTKVSDPEDDTKGTSPADVKKPWYRKLF